MKNALNHFYNIYAEDLVSIENGVYFFIQDYKYYFIEYDRSLLELSQLVKISNELYGKGVMVHTFITSIDGNFSVEFDDKNYVLLRVNCVEKEIVTLSDIAIFNKSYNLFGKNKVVLENWAELWGKKVDLFEKEMADLNKEYPFIQQTFDYYVGLAENAISYASDTFSSESVNYEFDISLNHRRIGSNICFGYLYNPLNFTFDYFVRDVSEYLKSKFFDGRLDFNEVDDFIKNNSLSSFGLRMLYARLLYPSYYFDVVENIFLKKNTEDDLKLICDKSGAYEDFLFDIGILLKKYMSIPLVDWIIAKDN